MPKSALVQSYYDRQRKRKKITAVLADVINQFGEKEISENALDEITKVM